MTNLEIDEKIKEMLVCSRIDAGKKQKDMSKLLGVHERTIQNWEAKESQPTPTQVARWFQELHANILIYFIKQFNNNELNDILLAIVLRLPDEAKKNLCLLDKLYGLEKLIDLRMKEIEVLNEK